MQQKFHKKGQEQETEGSGEAESKSRSHSKCRVKALALSSRSAEVLMCSKQSSEAMVGSEVLKSPGLFRQKDVRIDLIPQQPEQLWLLHKKNGE